nr:class I SAM-dependent methyltransferase [Salipiger pentaromativorans]
MAETYALYRPGYPVAAFAALADQVDCPARIAVDVGAGPGNSTRALRLALPQDWLVMAVEPGRDMRRVLARSFREEPRVQVDDGAAEALPLPDGSAGLIVACTAYHWFDRTAFFAEAARVLAPGGVLAMLRNRRVGSPLVAAFDAYVAEHSIEFGDFQAREKTKEPSVRDLGALETFRSGKSRTFGWQQETDCQGLIDLYLTRSTVWSLVRRIGLGQVIADLRAICDAQGATGRFTLEWETTVKWTRRR